MKRLPLGWGVCAQLLLVTSIASAELSATLETTTNRIWLHGTGEAVPAVILRSPEGYLVPGPAEDAGPFQEVLMNAPDEIAYTNIGSTLTLDGSFELPAGWDEGHYLDFNEQHFSVDPGILAHVSVIPVVPEPSSAVLLTLGSMACLALRRRRRPSV